VSLLNKGAEIVLCIIPLIGLMNYLYPLHIKLFYNGVKVIDIIYSLFFFWSRYYLLPLSHNKCFICKNK